MGEGDVKEEGSKPGREDGGGEPVRVQGLSRRNRKMPLLSHLTLTGEIKETAAGGRGVFISCVRNNF